MSEVLNSAIDDRSCSTCADAHNSELITGNESVAPVTQKLLEVKSMCGSNTVESVASIVGLILPSLDGAVCSGSKVRAVMGVVSWMRSDDRFMSCPSG